jgi:HEAT repeat protein
MWAIDALGGFGHLDPVTQRVVVEQIRQGTIPMSDLPNRWEGDPMAVAAVVEVSERSPNPRLRVAAQRQLASIYSDFTAAAIRELANRAGVDDDIRDVAQRSLLEGRDPVGVAAVAKRVTEGDPTAVKMAAESGIAALQIRVVEVLEGGSRDAKAAAVGAFYDVSDSPRVLAAAMALATDDAEFGAMAAERIVESASTSAVQPTIALAQSGPPRSRAVALTAIGRSSSNVAPDTALPILRHAASDANEDVSLSAVLGLSRLDPDGAELEILFDTTRDPALKRRVGDALKSCCDIAYGERQAAIDAITATDEPSAP